MISLIVTTRNHAHTLCRVAPSYFQQDDVDEVIFVDDAGDDDTASVIERIAAPCPRVHWRLLRNAVQLGPSQSRNVGVSACHNQFVMFCADDEYLEPGYARTCLDKLVSYGAAAVSGRRVGMCDDETPDQALRRFGQGLREVPPFLRLLGEHVDDACFEGDVRLPATNATILTRRDLLLRHPFDPGYGLGNSPQADADYQMNLFVHGHDIWITNDCHCIRLPPSSVTEGPPASAWRCVRTEVGHARRFYARHYAAYARRLGLVAPRGLALLAFSLRSACRAWLLPGLQRWRMAWATRRARWRHATPAH